MKNKRIFIIICLFVMSFLCNAQNKEQEGLVKTRGRLDSEGKVIPGVALPDASVILKGGNSTVSEKNGEFSILVPTEKYYLQSVQKQGYEIVDQDVLSKQYAYSKNPLVIVMETPQQQFDDELAAERKIRRTLTRQLHEREDEIERLKEEKKISDEEYRQALNKLYDDTENNEKLISDMAERYSKIDYDYLDDFYVKISNYILNGELTKADSMLNTRGNIDSDIESLNQLRDANAKERAELSKRQKKLKKSEAMAQHQMEDIAQRCYSKYEIFKMQHQNDSALYYLELRASLDTMNVEWLNDVGNFVEIYLSKYVDAMQYYQSALSLIKKHYTYDDRLLNRALNDIGLLYLKLDSLTQALDCFEESRLHFKEDDISSLSSIYRNMGTVYLRKGDFAETQKCYEKALELEIERTEIDRDNIAGVYNNLGILYVRLGEYEQAIECLQKALENRLLQGGEETVDVALVFHNIAAVFNKMGKYEQAIEYEKKSQVIYYSVYDKNHPTIANSYNELGAISFSRGDYDNALCYFTDAFEIYKEIYGVYHSDLALILNNIGQVYQSKSDFQKANENYVQALTMYKKLFGEENLYVAMIYTNIGVVCYYQCLYEQAIEYQEKALNIRNKLLKPNHPDIADNYKNIGQIYKSIGKVEEGIKYMFQALEIDISIYGENHPNVAIDYNNIAGAYQSLKEVDKAMEYNQKALTIRLSVYGEQHPDVARSYNGIGVSYLSIGDIQKSLYNINKAKSIWSSLYGENHADVGICYNNIGYIYQTIKDYNLALENYNHALKIFQSVYGEQHGSIGVLFDNIGMIYMEQENYEKSMEAFERAFKIRSVIFGENHHLTKRTLERLENAKAKIVTNGE